MTVDTACILSATLLYWILIIFIPNYTVSQKSSHLWTLYIFVKCEPIFKIFALLKSVWKFATEHIRQYPYHIRYVTKLPWEIKKSIFADIQQIWKKMQTNCKYLHLCVLVGLECMSVALGLQWCDRILQKNTAWVNTWIMHYDYSETIVKTLLETFTQ